MISPLEFCIEITFTIAYIVRRIDGEIRRINKSEFVLKIRRTQKKLLLIVAFIRSLYKATNSCSIQVRSFEIEFDLSLQSSKISKYFSLIIQFLNYNSHLYIVHIWKWKKDLIVFLPFRHQKWTTHSSALHCYSLWFASIAVMVIPLRTTANVKSTKMSRAKTTK